MWWLQCRVTLDCSRMCGLRIGTIYHADTPPYGVSTVFSQSAIQQENIFCLVCESAV